MKNNLRSITNQQTKKQSLFNVYFGYLMNKIKKKKDIIFGHDAESPFSINRHIKPISKKWGFERGLPVDRYYIEKFLMEHSNDIRGNVLEINDDNYTRRFGGDDVVTSDILDIDENNKNATIIADLQIAENIKPQSFDCVILTQTLQFIYDYSSVIQTCERILKSGGVLLATFSGISKMEIKKKYKSYWSFTSYSAQKMFEKYFDSDNLDIYKYGNVLSASAFLYGLATDELTKDELNYFDPEYEVIIAVRAVK